LVSRKNSQFGDGPIGYLYQELFHNNSCARDDHGDYPGHEIEGSTVSSKKCDLCRHLDYQHQGVGCADVAQAERWD